MMRGQARRSGLVMGLDTHMIAGSRACSTSIRLTHPTFTNETSPHFAEALGGGAVAQMFLSATAVTHRHRWNPAPSRDWCDKFRTCCLCREASAAPHASLLHHAPHHAAAAHSARRPRPCGAARGQGRRLDLTQAHFPRPRNLQHRGCARDASHRFLAGDPRREPKGNSRVAIGVDAPDRARTRYSRLVVLRQPKHQSGDRPA